MCKATDNIYQFQQKQNPTPSGIGFRESFYNILFPDVPNLIGNGNGARYWKPCIAKILINKTTAKVLSN